MPILPSTNPDLAAALLAPSIIAAPSITPLAGWNPATASRAASWAIARRPASPTTSLPLGGNGEAPFPEKQLDFFPAWSDLVGGALETPKEIQAAIYGRGAEGIQQLAEKAANTSGGSFRRSNHPGPQADSGISILGVRNPFLKGTTA